MTRLAGILAKLAIGAMGLMGFGSVAIAQSCSVSIDQLNFGQIRLANLSTSGTVSTVTADCTGQANETIRLCASFQGGDIMNVSASGYLLRVNLYSDVNYQIPWQSGIDIVLDGTGTGHATKSIYGRMSQISGSFKGGQYTGVINLALVGTYVSTGPICGAGSQSLRPAGVPKTVTSVKAVSARR